MTKINVNVSDRKENGKPEFCRRLTGTILPWRLRRVWPSFISTLTQDPGRAQQEVCERDGFGFCHQQWSKSNLGTSESNHSISPVVFIQRERERDQRMEVKMVERDRQWEDGGRRRIYCASKLLPHLSSLFYFTSLPSSSHPACLWPPAGTRICWEIRLVFSLGRESPASPQLYHTGIGEMCSWLWVSYLYYLLDYKKQVAFSYCALSLLSSVRHTWLDLSSVQFVSGHSRYFQYLSDIFPSY